MEPARNIELKARLPNLAAARQISQRLATAYLGVQQQTDTYFHCPQGRMKLREIVDFGDQQPATQPATRTPQRAVAQLISYDRADQTEAKPSHYQIVDISDPARVRQLKLQMGVHVIVVKRREIFLYHNVRIHLDEVSGLGTFVEFEAVLGANMDEAGGRAQVAKLQKEFGLQPADLIATSYADMLAAK
jgi:predicted adenylyl cyclase CyaB